MIRVIRDGNIYKLRDGNQLSAFLNSGWKIYEKKKVEAEPALVVKEEKPKPKRRRKKASK